IVDLVPVLVVERDAVDAVLHLLDMLFEEVLVHLRDAPDRREQEAVTESALPGVLELSVLALDRDVLLEGLGPLRIAVVGDRLPLVLTAPARPAAAGPVAGGLVLLVGMAVQLVGACAQHATGTVRLLEGALRTVPEGVGVRSLPPRLGDDAAQGRDQLVEPSRTVARASPLVADLVGVRAEEVHRSSPPCSAWSEARKDTSTLPRPVTSRESPSPG